MPRSLFQKVLWLKPSFVQVFTHTYKPCSCFGKYKMFIFFLFWFKRCKVNYFLSELRNNNEAICMLDRMVISTLTNYFIVFIGTGA